MIISHKHRFLFVEIPHTASHSISEQLVAHCSGEPILRKHANVTQFLGAASAAEKSYFRFATVRNPLDSATTDYAKLVGNHKQQFTNPAMLMENGGHVTKDHLAEFHYVQDDGADFGSFFRKFRNRLYNNWFLLGDTHFDYVIRFESLQQGFSEVLERLNVKPIEPIPHVNKTKTKRKSYTEFYTPDTYQQAARCYGPFMKKWGYDLPREWGEVSVPGLSQAQFSFIDGCAQFGAKYFTLDPDDPVLHRFKKIMDYVTKRK